MRKLREDIHKNNIRVAYVHTNNFINETVLVRIKQQFHGVPESSHDVYLIANLAVKNTL